jgi:hypothetical protein
MSQAPARSAVDPLTTYSAAFDLARGITREMRMSIQWIAENGRWLRRSPLGWLGVCYGRYTLEWVPHELVIELSRVGMLELLSAMSKPLPPDDHAFAEHARLVQVA